MVIFSHFFLFLPFYYQKSFNSAPPPQFLLTDILYTTESNSISSSTGILRILVYLHCRTGSIAHWLHPAIVYNDWKNTMQWYNSLQNNSKSCLIQCFKYCYLRTYGMYQVNRSLVYRQYVWTILGWYFIHVTCYRWN